MGNEPDGSPVARLDGTALPFAVSLTDRAGWAVCALAPVGTGLGCDMELVEARSDAFVRDYLTDAEQRLVARATDPAVAANLAWSAKESALKVLRQGLRRPTRSVEAHPDPEAGGGAWAPLRVALAEGGELAGWWRMLGPFVVTVAASRPTGPPVALVEPPPGW